jgi:hypothetical protein
MPKKGEKGKYQGGGYPRFRPSQAQRNAVRIMAGVKMAVDEIRQVVLNPLTGLPLTKSAMYRHFKRELQDGPPSLKQLIAEKYVAHLREGREYAVRLGLKNRYGWSTEGAPPPPSVLGIVHDQEPTMKIEFVMPGKKPESESPPPIIDATPQPEQPLSDLARCYARQEVKQQIRARNQRVTDYDPRAWLTCHRP